MATVSRQRFAFELIKPTLLLQISMRTAGGADYLFANLLFTK
jgi:hypothetical protein